MPTPSLPQVSTAGSPLLTAPVMQLLLAARPTGSQSVEVSCSLDLGRSMTVAEAKADGWAWNGGEFPYVARCKERTVYLWSGHEFEAAARYGASLVKLVPTEWGAPTFEIDGIKMLPTSKRSPYEDAAEKVALVRPRGRFVLDTCGGLGYFAAQCIRAGAAAILSFEKNAEVLWLRTINPWSPASEPPLDFRFADVTQAVTTLPDASVDAILHDPPRFAIAGELYSQDFYGHLARIARGGARLFHYTGAPNSLSHGRDLPGEVLNRLTLAGFRTERHGDGLLAVRR